MNSITAVLPDSQAGQDQTPNLPNGFPIDTKTTKHVVDEEALLEYMTVWREQLKQNWQGGYTQMPDEVAADPSLSPRAKHVYRALLSFMWRGTDRCWPSQMTLAEATGYSRSTVIRALCDLYERGYIERWRRGLNQTNYYFINPLSFVKSFKTPWRGRGVLLKTRSLEHRATVEDTPAPLIPLCGMCQVETPSSSNVEQQAVATCNTKHTNQNQINESSMSSNHSTAASGSDVAGAAIRKANDEPASDAPTTTKTEGTNPSPIPTQPSKTNPNEKQQDELAAPRRAKEALAAKMGNPHGGAEQIALATGIPAEHLAELGVALERKKRHVPDFIENVIRDFSRELGDNPRSHKSSVTRATKIYYTMLDIFTNIRDDPEGHFLRAMYDARTAAKHIANVRHHTGTHTNRMPAFFTCLQNWFEFTPEELEYLKSDEPLYYPDQRQ